jgi:hypothetical protein
LGLIGRLFEDYDQSKLGSNHVQVTFHPATQAQF